ncbi:MAG: phosphodiester glycosidase family protein [Capsulimonadaceae bacterium]
MTISSLRNTALRQRRAVLCACSVLSLTATGIPAKADAPVSAAGPTLSLPDGQTPATATPTPATAVQAAASVKSRVTRPLAAGVTWTQEIDDDPPLIINVVTADLSAPGVHAHVGPAQDHVGGTDPTFGREEVSRYARRHHDLVAVNGDFFPFTGDPLGIEIHAGDLLSEPWIGMTGKGGPRTVLGVTDDGRAVIDRLGLAGQVVFADESTGPLHGVNRAVGVDEVVVFTPDFHGGHVNRANGLDVGLANVNLPLRANKQMRGQVIWTHTTPDGVDVVPPGGVILAGGPRRGTTILQAGIHLGDAVTFTIGTGAVSDPASGLRVAALPRGDDDLPSRAGEPADRTAWLWARIPEAIGGGPRLLSNGAIDIDSVDEGFEPGFVDFPYPRTAVGVSADGHVLIVVTVDGRQTISRGVSLADLAAILKRFGASDAMNLDGGGSTTMAVAGLIVDSPGGEGMERPVADMLTVDADQPSVTIPNWDPAGRAPASIASVAQVPDTAPASTVPSPASVSDQAGSVPNSATPSPLAGRAGEGSNSAQPGASSVTSNGSSALAGAAGETGESLPAADPASFVAPAGAPAGADAPSYSLVVSPATIVVGQTAACNLEVDGDAVAPASTDLIWVGPAFRTSTPAVPPAIDTSWHDPPAQASRAGATSAPAANTGLDGKLSTPVPVGAPPAALSGRAVATDGVPASATTSSAAGATASTGGTPVGFVDQRGVFTALRAGTGIVTALYRGQILSTAVTVTAGSESGFALIKGLFGPDPSGARNRNILSIHIVRQDGSPVGGATVHVLVTGGAADVDEVSTDPDGAASTAVTWDANTGGLVTLSLPGSPSMTLGQGR